MIIAKKNAAYYLSFPAIDSASPASYKSGISPVDTAYYKDGAGAWTSLAITDTATEIGSSGVYEIDLTSGEMNHDKVLIKFSVSGMADDAYQFDTSDKLTDDLQDISTTQVNTECDTALADYDGPTNAEMVARTRLDADYFSWATDAVANVTLVATTTLNSDMVGTDDALLAASYTAPDNASITLILADTNELQLNQGNWLTATGFAVPGDAMDINQDGIDAIWDEELTGATHNVPTSSGRRLRGLQDFGNYLGRVNIDTINGTAGVVIDENGTLEAPVLTLVDALTINATVNYNAYLMSPASAITLSQTFNNTVWSGKDSWTLILNGKDIANSTFEDATVTGIATGVGVQHFKGGTLGAVSLPANTHIMRGAQIVGTQTLPVGDIFYDDCRSGIAGVSAPQFDFGAAVGGTNLNLRSYSGGVDIRNMGQSGTDNMSLEGDGQLIINANCIGGTIAIRGNWHITGATAFVGAGGVIEYDDDSANIISILEDTGTSGVLLASTATSEQLVDDVWDEIISKASHNIGQSAAKILRQGGDLVQIDGAVTDASPSVADFDTNLTQVDGYFDDAVLIFSDGAANVGIGRPVVAYLNAGGNMTFSTPDDWPVTPVNGDDFVIYATHVHPISQIQASILSDATPFAGADIAIIESAVDATVEPTSPPSPTATLGQKGAYVFAKAANEFSQTSTTQTVRNSGDTDDISTSAVSDDGSTFTKGKDA